MVGEIDENIDGRPVKGGAELILYGKVGRLGAGKIPAVLAHAGFIGRNCDTESVLRG
jgi:hypothetical protein